MESSLVGVGQLHISVSDLDASVRWYRDVLGLPLLFTVPGRPMAFLDAGGVYRSPLSRAGAPTSSPSRAWCTEPTTRSCGWRSWRTRTGSRSR